MLIMQIDENSTEGTILWSISIIDSEYTYKIVFQRLVVLEVDRLPWEPSIHRLNKQITKGFMNRYAVLLFTSIPKISLRIMV